jgi:S1-C subfamily serine protease
MFRPLTKVFRTIGLLTLLLVAGLATAAAQRTPQQLFEKISPSVFLLTRSDANGKLLSTGTGFMSESGRIVTNYHVVKDGKISAKIGPLTIPVAVENTDTTNDLASLSFEGKAAVTGLKLASALPKPGERVYVIGNPAGLENTISEGLISGIRSVEERSLLQLTAPISPGSSGSPVVNAAGEVVGVIVSTLESGQNLNFAVPSREVVSLLASDKKRVLSPEVPASPSLPFLLQQRQSLAGVAPILVRVYLDDNLKKLLDEHEIRTAVELRL